jgi:RNA polymerase sigma-70 factor, ECF subfamily
MTKGMAGSTHSEIFEQHRRRLLGLAYSMLGSVMDAEDVVQDVYLRWSNVELASVGSPPAYLTTITTRLAINALTSARVRREQYVGPWLPEPVVIDFEADPSAGLLQAEGLSLAMLTALERLNPTERAVLLLRDVFDLEYSEIADVVDKSPANCRQVAARARERVGDVARRRPIDSESEARLLTEYIAAVTSDDVERLARVFAEDVVLWADGGGVARAARHPLSGAWRVARHLVGVAPQAPQDTRVRLVRANGDPALLATVDGRGVALIAFETVDGRVAGVRAVLNPEKLGHLGP